LVMATLIVKVQYKGTNRLCFLAFTLSSIFVSL
jgi:hypothetical protein